MMKVRLLGLILITFFYSCSEDSNSTDPDSGSVPDNPIVVDATIDGASLSVSNIHAKYFPNQKAAEITATLSDGRMLSIRYGAYIIFQMGEFTNLAYVKITDADGSNAFSTLYNMPRRYAFFNGVEGIQIAESVGINFTGKLFANENDPNSTFHYFQCRILSPYEATDETQDLVWYESTNYNPTNVWYSVKKKQNSLSGQPIDLMYTSDGEKRFRIRFETVPTVGYHNIDSTSPYRVEATKYNSATEQYPQSTSSGIMQITEVGPNYVKGTFSITGNIIGGPSFSYQNYSFACSYN